MPHRFVWFAIPCLFFGSIALPSVAQNRPTLQRKGREHLSLDGLWAQREDPENTGESRGWHRKMPQDTSLTLVPTVWTRQEAVSGAAHRWYWKEFEISKKWSAPNLVRLQFGGVVGKATVWLNGDLVGEHTEGITPFIFHLTPFSPAGKKHLLAVRVENTASAPGSLWQSVAVITHDEAYLESCHPQPEPNGLLQVPIVLTNTTARAGDAELEATLYEATNLRRPARATRQILHITPRRNVTTLMTSIPRRNLKLWSLEKPDLYVLRLALRQDKDILDSWETRFGFRRLEWKTDGLLLNGSPIALSSASLAEARALMAETQNPKQSREAVQRVKAQGYNVLALEAPHPALLNLADELGLLVVIYTRSGLARPQAIAEMRALMERDRTHPCILAWHVGEISLDEAESLRPLDPTRPLLIGPAAALRLWLPNLPAPSEIPLPAGLLPS